MARKRHKAIYKKHRSPEAAATAPDAYASGKASRDRLKILICVVLALVTLVAYWQVFGSEFTGYDDTEYVTQNPYVLRGLSLDSLTWAFTTFHSANWHPVTWISHMADVQVYGFGPGGHHFTSLLFHVINALILFLVLNRMTGSIWRSGFVAALFAVHPLHVESVAWVAERKDVLCTFFYLVTVYAYVLYTERPQAWRYTLMLAMFALALMSKPMAVSLPLVLILLDYWPLGRAGRGWGLVREKTPLFAMSIASAVITFIAQKAGGSVVSLVGVSFGYRLGNALISYVMYILKMLWPSGLAMFYPLVGKGQTVLQSTAAGVLLIAGTVVILRYGRRARYLTMGWLWYLITLAPVIGIVQVGMQSMADRYTYITLTGLFIMIAWGIPDIASRARTRMRWLLAPLAAAVILTLSVVTWSQVRVWHDSYSLFDHAIKVTKNNYIAYNNRGGVLLTRGALDDAIADFQEALKLQPRFAEAHGNLGHTFVELGKHKKGIEHGLLAIKLGYDTPILRYQIALGYARTSRFDLAIEQCKAAIKLAPGFPAPHNLLGEIYGMHGEIDKAIPHLRKSAELDPDASEPHGNLALAYLAKRDYKAAWKEVYIFRSKGGKMPEEIIARLSAKMPDPGR